MDPYAVNIDSGPPRQRRLLDAIEPLESDFAILTRRESVQWLTGVHVRAPFEPIAVLRADGHLTLVLPDRQSEEPAAADEVIGYEEKWYSTTRDEQLAASSAVVQQKITSKPKRIACE